MHKHEGTLDDIHKQVAPNLSKTRVYQYSAEAGFPEPLYKVGRIKIYDLRQAARYFANRTDRRRTA